MSHTDAPQPIHVRTPNKRLATEWRQNKTGTTIVPAQHVRDGGPSLHSARLLDHALLRRGSVADGHVRRGDQLARRCGRAAAAGHLPGLCIERVCILRDHAAVATTGPKATAATAL